MRDILFLTHRIPYPPDKGEKIRAWNLLCHLTATHRVHLGFFVDAPDDFRYVEKLRAMCASVFWRPLKPRLARLRSLRGLFTGASLTEGYFYDVHLKAQIDKTIARHRPSEIYVFSSAMTQYVMHGDAARVIVDLVDVDSEKWRQYAAARRGVAHLIYAREGRTLLALEQKAVERADAAIFVSRAEAELFRRLAPHLARRIHYVSNGVDYNFFDPANAVPNPFDERPAIVFTGTMNYRPNIDAMTWFAEQVMPRLRTHPARPRLWIVGSSPTAAVKKLARPDIRVTGRVPDIRPYLAHARAVVAPMQIARGIQNKVLEAMAMGAAVVVTPQAREGLDACGDDELFTATTPEEFADAVTRLLDGGEPSIGLRARRRILDDFGWEASLTSLDRLLDGESFQGLSPIPNTAAPGSAGP